MEEIVSRKDTISNLFLQKRELPAPTKSIDTDRVRTGAIGAMGASLKEMAESAKQVTELQKQLDSADTVLDIDPSQIDHSRVADRISIEVDTVFDTLVESIRDNGQQVPVLLRPHPDDASRYQIAYGRRRLRAAQTLGIKVKALVRKLSDDELIVAQGRENLDRQDLSFIEKAFFAKSLESEGIERSVIISALGMDKADVSRMISVANNVPEDLVRRIGSAPKAGRKRWMELLEQLENTKRLAAASEFLCSGQIEKWDSDQRFSKLLNELRKLSNEDPDTSDKGAGASAAKSWTSNNNTVTMIVNQTTKNYGIELSNVGSIGFGNWITDHMDRLFDEYQKTKSGD